MYSYGTLSQCQHRSVCWFTTFSIVLEDADAVQHTCRLVGTVFIHEFLGFRYELCLPRTRDVEPDFRGVISIRLGVDVAYITSLKMLHQRTSEI